MKTLLTFFALLIVLKSSAFAKIVMIDDKVFLRNDGQQVPVFAVNDLIEKNKVKKVHLYGEGRVHLISFAIKNNPEKLYSIDEKGFIYAIEPYSKFKVGRIVEDNRFVFQEMPGKQFRVTEKGYFIHY
jgi:hypothetical protein